MKLKKIFAVIFFSIIFVLPIIIQYFTNGPLLSGNDYIENRAFIQNFNDLINYLSLNVKDYLYFLSNPIFIFFIVAYFVQKIMSLIVADDWG